MTSYSDMSMPIRAATLIISLVMAKLYRRKEMLAADALEVAVVTFAEAGNDTSTFLMHSRTVFTNGLLAPVS